MREQSSSGVKKKRKKRESSRCRQSSRICGSPATETPNKESPWRLHNEEETYHTQDRVDRLFSLIGGVISIVRIAIQKIVIIVVLQVCVYQHWFRITFAFAFHFVDRWSPLCYLARHFRCRCRLSRLCCLTSLILTRLGSLLLLPAGGSFVDTRLGLCLGISRSFRDLCTPQDSGAREEEP